jgi:hypothetical protein
MKAKIKLKVELLAGPDAGYTIEEQNRIVEVNRLPYEHRPYQVTVEFVTPDMYREWREISKGGK